MKLLFSFILIFLTSILALNAQNAKIELLDGTHLEGEIDYNGWVKTPSEIKVSVQGETVVYTPFQILGFEVNGDRYVSRVVDLNTTGQNLQSLTDFTKLESIEKRVFLKALVQGNIGLYTYSDTRIHFFATKGSDITELLRLKRLKKATLNRYVGQLNILFSDCNQPPRAENIQFSATSLKRAVVAYNECVAGNSLFIEKKYPIQVSLYVVGGYKTSSLEIANQNWQLDSNSSGSPTYGLGMDVNLLRKTKKLQLYNELLLQSYKFEASYREQRLEQQYIDYFLNVDVSYVEINSLIRYNFGSDSDKLNVFANAGVNNAIQLSDSSTEYSNSFFFGEVNRMDREPLDGGIKTSRLSFSLGLGLRYKFAHAELRYGFKPKLSDFPAISNTNDLNFLLAFKVL